MAKNSNNGSSTKLYVRIIALILGILMILGVAIILIEVLAYDLFASEENMLDVDTSEDITVRIGLIYGSSVVKSISLTTLSGFSVGSQELEDDKHTYKEFFKTNQNLLYVTSDQNLKVDDTGYVPTTSSSDITIGGYHVQVSTRFNTYNECSAAIKTASPSLEAINLAGGCYAYPCYDKGYFYIRIYDFASEESASNKVSKFKKIFSNASITVVSPNKEFVSLIDPASNRILIQFRGTSQSQTLGLKPLPSVDSRNNEDYITVDSRLYQDVICFRKETSSHAFAVINVVRLEEYVEGVLPYEILTSWPIETQKAFAIIVRTYTLKNLNKRQTNYGFDLVNTSSDQVYKGAQLVNDDVRKAVKETRGIIMTYNGEIGEVYYAHAFGNCSVSPSDVWSGNYPEYLHAVSTPWESYMDKGCSGGFWISEVSAKELCTYLRKTQGFSQLKGSSIESIEIKSYAKNSSYINCLVITDNLGNKVELNRCSNIRNALIKYVYSANFVVGKGSVIYTTNSVKKLETEEIATESLSLTTIVDLAKSFIDTALGVFKGNSNTSYSVLTSKGMGVVTNEATVIYSNIVSIGHKYQTTQETQIYKCENTGNFVFVGKGYGHGVGISQYGAYCLGVYGYNAEEIIEMYFQGIQYSKRSEIIK